MKAGEIIKSYLKRFPKLPSLSLAKKIYKENQLQFTSVEYVRGRIRYYRGKNGDTSRERLKYDTFSKVKIEYNLPESFAETFIPFDIKQSRTLIISDLHLPFQDNLAIKLALDYGKQKKVDCILINGDLLDFTSISRHEKDWKQRTVFQEFEAARTFLKTLREHFPKAKIVFKEGNHDERWEKWLFTQAPLIFDDPEYQLEIRLRLAELKIDIVKDKRPVKIGKLTVLHGHEMVGGSGGVNPARATFLKTLDSVLVGHYHKTSQHTEASLFGNVFSVNSMGCLTGLHPGYMRINKWNHGFAYCELDLKTGDYSLENLKIVNGKIYK